MLVIGMVIGWLWREHHFTHVDNMVQRDTVVRFDTIHYSWIDLSANTMKLDVPKIDAKELVYLETSSLDTIYRDSVRYVTYPREYFYTKVEDAEIWHSGIDSRIDSLNIFRERVKITEQIGGKNVKHRLGVGVEANYYDKLYVPVYAEYESLIKPWFSIYGRVGYNIPTQDVGLSLGVRLQIQW